MGLADTKEGRLKIIVAVGLLLVAGFTAWRVATVVYEDRARDEAAAIGAELKATLDPLERTTQVRTAVEAVLDQHGGASVFGESAGHESAWRFVVRVTRGVWHHCALVEWRAREETLITLRSC